MQIIKINKLSHFSAETGKDRFMNENVQKCQSENGPPIPLWGVRPNTGTICTKL